MQFIRKPKSDILIEIIALALKPDHTEHGNCLRQSFAVRGIQQPILEHQSHWIPLAQHLGEVTA